MEDDDEFGDLYTDVLRPLSAASQSQQISPAPPSLHRPIDLKTNLQDSPHPASVPNSTFPHTVMPESRLPNSHASSRADKDSEFTDKDVKVKFDIEEGNGISNDDDGLGIEIPGISQNDVGVRGGSQNDVVREEGEEDDWESDSEDDLQIVLNEENHRPMLIDEGGGDDDDDDDDDEDGDPLVIVDDVDASNHQGLMVEEQEWGGDDVAAQMGEAGVEKKEGIGERANGAAAPVSAAMAKIGYSNHFAYHNPYHSQFKYVRPGAAPIPGSATVGAGGPPGLVRPLVNLGSAAGRGRGDWRPTGMKTAPPFHPSFGVSASGVNMTGRGLEFTLPSHKSIFDVDIDGFEEKPWKYPSVDISDFFNFGLNEESWKDYCKQLEQYRLETTMQSKIRVYESGRDQEYDPDLPPELAAATGILDITADNANLGKSDVRQSDLTKGLPRMRPPIPTGRAIQVEGGFGERLPSIDTRPPRIRDSDAIIEIVCQESADDDSSTGNGDQDDLPREDHREESCGAEDEMRPVDSEYFDGFPEAYDSRRKELVRSGAPNMNIVHDNIPKGNGPLPFPPEAPVQNQPGSRGPTPKYPSENIGTSNEQRRRPGRTGDRSTHRTPSHSPQMKKFHDNQAEESVEIMEGKHSPSSFPVMVRDDREVSVEHEDAVHDELVTGDGSSAMEKEETNTVTTSDNHKDGKALHSSKKQKIISQVEQTDMQEFDEEEDCRAARSSENSKVRSGSSRDHKKWQEGVEEEVMQDGRSTRLGSMKKHLEDNERSFRRKDREGRQEMERNHMVAKGRVGSYPHREFDPSLVHDMQMKSEGFDWRKERENSDGVWQRKEDEYYSRKNKIEEARKMEREHLDEIGLRHRSKARKSERTDRDEYLLSRKQLDNGSYRLHYDNDSGPQHRERDDNLKSRNEMANDYISKRRKDDEYIRRDHTEKDEILHSHRDSTSRRKRERDDILDQRRREDQQKIRGNFDDQLSVRHKDKGWLQRESGERQREREEWHTRKPHEETLPKREREGRGTVRSGRSSEDRALVGHARMKDEFRVSDKEYQIKETVQHGDPKRRGRIEDESLPPHRGREDVYARGNQFSNEERRSRQERSGPHNDRAANTSDNIRVNEKKRKESSRKNIESEVEDHSGSVASKRNQEDQSGHISEMGIKGTLEQGNAVNEKTVHRNSSRKQKEEASSDDEQQDSRRGRSKLERWTSNKERDFIIDSKSSASLKLKEINKNNGGRTSEITKLPEEPVTAVEPVNKHPLADKKDGGNPDIKGADTKPADDRHLDTVEKLKKRSERFKLPLPIEKDTLAVKKMESEPLPSTKSETPADSEVKQERPARKRRWISS